MDIQARGASLVTPSQALAVSSSQSIIPDQIDRFLHFTDWHVLPILYFSSQ